MQEELHPLKRALLEEYGHFADRRIKNLDKSNSFIIDDRDKGRSFASDGTPYGWFCEMFLDVISRNAVRITIRGNLPIGPDVTAWLDRNGVKAEKPFNHLPPTRSFVITPADIDELLALADALKMLVERRIVREKSDWYVAPRVAACLCRIRDALKQHWNTV